MEKIRLFVFEMRLFLRRLVFNVIRLFSEKLSEKYRGYARRARVNFGRKAVRKGWNEILKNGLRYFVESPEFRRDLILSTADNDVVLQIYKRYACKVTSFSNEEVELVAKCRKFNNVNIVDLIPFKNLLFSSAIDNRKDVIKLFYKNTCYGETRSELANELIVMYSDDPDFIFWLVMNDSAFVLRQYFVENILSKTFVTPEEENRFKQFVEVVGFRGIDLNFKKRNALLLRMRQYMERPIDIEVWEECLLNYEDVITIKKYIRTYGIRSEKGLQNLLDKNDYWIIDSYKKWKQFGQ